MGSAGRHARQRRGIPERLLLSPPPRDPDLAARYAALSFERRRALVSASGRGGRIEGCDEEQAVLRGLAAARVATGWRLHLGAIVLGWLVWMTVYGVGRTSLPGPEARWLWVGLATGSVVAIPAAVSARRRVRRARAVASGAVRPEPPRHG